MQRDAAVEERSAMWTANSLERPAREVPRASRFPGVRARPPAWKLGTTWPPASPVAAELLRNFMRDGLVELPPSMGSRMEWLVTTGWSRGSSLLTSTSFSLVLQIGSEPPRRRLTQRELQVAALAARGYKSRRIGEALSIAAATARGATERALRKLELSSTMQLVLVWHTLARSHQRYRDAEGAEWLLFRTDFERSQMPRLTAVKRQIVLGLMSGERSSEIAERRSVSARTIANHVASLLRRFDVASRAELMLRLLEPDNGRRSC